MLLTCILGGVKGSRKDPGDVADSLPPRPGDKSTTGVTTFMMGLEGTRRKAGEGSWSQFRLVAHCGVVGAEAGVAVCAREGVGVPMPHTEHSLVRNGARPVVGSIVHHISVARRLGTARRVAMAHQ